MGMRVSVIELKEVEVIELEDGSYEKRYINPKKYPAFLTHRALAKGRNMGITNTSLISELIRMQDLVGENQEIDMEHIKPEQADIIEADKYLPVIYLGIIGANKILDLSYENFLDQYQGDIEQILNDYMDLVMPYIQQNPNEFRKGLIDSTKKN